MLDRVSSQLGMGRPETIGMALRLLEASILRSGSGLNQRPGPSAATLEPLLERIVKLETERIELLQRIEASATRADRRAAFRALAELATA